MKKSVFTYRHTVQPQETALSVGSGTLEVFSTPSLGALMEKAAVGAVAGELSEGETTVGAEIHIEHLKASAVGETLTVTAEVKAHEGSSIFLHIEVKNERNDLIGRARHVRVVVDPRKFMSRINGTK